MKTKSSRLTTPLRIMLMIGIACGAGLSLSCKRNAVTTTSTKITVIGDATLNAEPDVAVVILSVVTQSQNALEAQQQNAAKTDAVINAVKGIAGGNAEIKTNSYTVQPQNDYRDNRLPKIVGYETRNSLIVRMSDLTKVGAVVDAASHAGANSVDRVSFNVSDSSVVNGQALAEATRQAMAKAKSIAEAMRGRVTRLVEEQETLSPQAQSFDISNALTTMEEKTRGTPFQPGPMRVNSRVQLIVEVDAQPK